MGDDARSFRVGLDDLDRVANVQLPELVTSAEIVTKGISAMPDALPLSEPFPSASKINESYAELQEALAAKHASAAQVLQDTTNALSEIARIYRVADGQSYKS